MVVDIEILDQDAIVLLFRDIIDCGANERYSIEMRLVNLFALLRRVAANDLRARFSNVRWNVRGGGWLCESSCNQG